MSRWMCAASRPMPGWRRWRAKGRAAVIRRLAEPERFARRRDVRPRPSRRQATGSCAVSIQSCPSPSGRANPASSPAFRIITGSRPPADPATARTGAGPHPASRLPPFRGLWNAAMSPLACRAAPASPAAVATDPAPAPDRGARMRAGRCAPHPRPARCQATAGCSPGPGPGGRRGGVRSEKGRFPTTPPGAGSAWRRPFGWFAKPMGGAGRCLPFLPHMGMIADMKPALPLPAAGRACPCHRQGRAARMPAQAGSRPRLRAVKDRTP